MCSVLWIWGKQLSQIKIRELDPKLSAKKLFVVFTKIFSLWGEHYCAVLCFRVNYCLHSSPHWLKWTTQRLPLGCFLPTVLWVSMLSCLTYFTNNPQTTHHISRRSSTYMLSTESPQGCEFPNSWGFTTLRSVARGPLYVSKHDSHAEGAAATLLPHTQKKQSGAETADVLILHHHLESASILYHCLGCCLHSSWQEKSSWESKVSD